MSLDRKMEVKHGRVLHHYNKQAGPFICFSHFARGQEAVGIKVIDLRTISPLDREAFLKSVVRTGKLVVAEESRLICGQEFTEEIIGKIGERTKINPSL